MLRVVLDTNVRISSAVFGGLPRAVDLTCKPPFATALISARMIVELRRHLGRFWAEAQVHREIQNVRERSVEVAPDLLVEACRDPDDNRILECAIAGKAQYIITGDKDLLTLQSFEGVAILTVRQFHDTFPRSFPKIEAIK